MGLFQKKTLEDDVAVLPRQTPAPSARNKNGSVPPVPQSQQTVSQRPLPSQTPTVTAAPNYGIEQLVSLMRDLPNGNVELVVRVLKKTLESVNISVPQLIQQAGARESELEERMAGHRRAIAALEEEISSKRRAIEELEAHYKEVMVVKERLNLGLSLDQHAQQGVSVTGAPAHTPPREEVVNTIVGRGEAPPSVIVAEPGRGPNRG